MAQRTIYFDLNSLTRLLTHYSEGGVPLDARAVEFKVSRFLQRWIGLVLESKDWPEASHEDMFVFRYEGKRVLTWTDKHDELKWGARDAIEAPKQQ